MTTQSLGVPLSWITELRKKFFFCGLVVFRLFGGHSNLNQDPTYVSETDTHRWFVQCGNGSRQETGWSSASLQSNSTLQWKINLGRVATASHFGPRQLKTSENKTASRLTDIIAKPRLGGAFFISPMRYNLADGRRQNYIFRRDRCPRQTDAFRHKK